MDIFVSDSVPDLLSSSARSREPYLLVTWNLEQKSFQSDGYYSSGSESWVQYPLISLSSSLASEIQFNSKFTSILALFHNHNRNCNSRVELKPFGIDVITVAPGAIKSNIASNSSAVYKNNPEWRFYKPFQKAIYERIEFSQKPGNTPTDVFAEKTVDAILRRKPPAWFSYGQYSTLSGILYYLPIWLRDVIMRKLYKVSVIENAKEK